jgi:hypothetical protein
MFKNNEVSPGGFICSENVRLPERNLFDFSKPDIIYFKVQALVFPLLKIYPNVRVCKYRNSVSGRCFNKG